VETKMSIESKAGGVGTVSLLLWRLK
jgi:hypothetical protein